jgi:hypothetical protein
LAKQNGKQAEVIRKLRAKEKTTENEVKKLKADTEKLTGQNTSCSLFPSCCTGATRYLECI